MCFICQNTGEVFISPEDRDPIYSNGTTRKEPCPICNDFSFKELDRIIIEHKIYNKIIKSIRMNQSFLDEIGRLKPMEKISDSHPNHILKGITITIDNNIKQWEIEYEK